MEKSFTFGGRKEEGHVGKYFDSISTIVTTVSGLR